MLYAKVIKQAYDSLVCCISIRLLKQVVHFTYNNMIALTYIYTFSLWVLFKFDIVSCALKGLVLL